MEIYQLKTFLKVADLNNITRSADEMHISQPSVSAHIKALEDELGVLLFTRTHKGMEITPNGEKLKVAAEQVINSVDSMIQMSRELQANSKREIHISTNTFPEVLKINELLSKTVNGELNIDFTISYRNTHQILENIRDAKIDCGFAYGDFHYNELGSLLLANIPLRIIGPKSWADKLSIMNLDELMELPWIFMNEDCPFYDAANETLKELRTKMGIATRVDHEDQILNLVTSAIGISIIPEYTLDIPERSRNLYVYPDIGMKVKLSFCYLKKRENDPVVEMLKKQLANIWGL